MAWIFKTAFKWFEIRVNTLQINFINIYLFYFFSKKSEFINKKIIDDEDNDNDNDDAFKEALLLSIAEQNKIIKQPLNMLPEKNLQKDLFLFFK